MTITVKNASGSNVTISTIDDLLSVVSTASLQTAGNASLTTIIGHVDGVEASLASILAKLITSPATEAKQDTANTALASILAKLVTSPATEAKQDTANTSLTTIIGHVDGVEASLASILAKIITAPATEAKQDTANTSLASILAKIITSPATEAKQDTANTSLASILAKIITAPATEAKQDTAITAINRVGTRSYGTVERVAVGSTATQSAALTATEVLVHASTKCYILAGSGTPAPTNTTGIPIEAGEKFHLRITSGHKIGVIRDSADGFLHVVVVT